MNDRVVQLISEFIHQVMFKNHNKEFYSIPFTYNDLIIQYNDGTKIKVTFEEL